MKNKNALITLCQPYLFDNLKKGFSKSLINLLQFIEQFPLNKDNIIKRICYGNIRYNNRNLLYYNDGKEPLIDSTYCHNEISNIIYKQI